MAERRSKSSLFPPAGGALPQADGDSSANGNAPDDRAEPQGDPSKRSPGEDGAAPPEDTTGKRTGDGGK